MKIFNTLTRQKEEFVPLEEGKVKMYVCGPTVYNLIHIGNARPMIIFDTVRRYLEYKGYEVNYVSNFTDVDDKISTKVQRTSVVCIQHEETKHLQVILLADLTHSTEVSKGLGHFTVINIQECP